MPEPIQKELAIAVPGAGKVFAILARPAGAHALFVLAHGAGAGMRHPFLESLARALAAEGIATLRYQFPYMEQRRKAPDRPKLLTETVRAAVAASVEGAAGLPIFAGGKSMGGRMTSLAASQQKVDGVRGLIFVGFPLHPPNKPGVERAEHLQSVGLPMLFLQGTRDPLARLDLLEPVCAKLIPAPKLHIVDTADHSFHVLKRTGKTDEQVLQGLAQTISSWTKTI